MESLSLLALGLGFVYYKQRRAMVDDTPSAQAVLRTEAEMHAANNVPDEHLPSKLLDKVMRDSVSHNRNADTDQINPELDGSDRARLAALGEERRHEMRNGMQPPAARIQSLTLSRGHYD